jgi:hypothetical protein
MCGREINPNGGKHLELLKDLFVRYLLVLKSKYLTCNSWCIKELRFVPFRKIRAFLEAEVEVRRTKFEMASHTK